MALWKRIICSTDSFISGQYYRSITGCFLWLSFIYSCIAKLTRISLSAHVNGEGETYRWVTRKSSTFLCLHFLNASSVPNPSSHCCSALDGPQHDVRRTKWPPVARGQLSGGHRSKGWSPEMEKDDSLQDGIMRGWLAHCGTLSGRCPMKRN